MKCKFCGRVCKRGLAMHERHCSHKPQGGIKDLALQVPSVPNSHVLLRGRDAVAALTRAKVCAEGLAKFLGQAIDAAIREQDELEEARLRIKMERD